MDIYLGSGIEMSKAERKICKIWGFHQEYIKKNWGFHQKVVILHPYIIIIIYSMEDGEYEVYHGSKDTPLGRYNNFNAPKNTIIVVNTGGIGGVKFLENEFWCSDGSFWLGSSENVNPKFLYYYLVQFEDYFYSKKKHQASHL